MRDGAVDIEENVTSHETMLASTQHSKCKLPFGVMASSKDQDMVMREVKVCSSEIGQVPKLWENLW